MADVKIENMSGEIGKQYLLCQFVRISAILRMRGHYIHVETLLRQLYFNGVTKQCSSAPDINS